MSDSSISILQSGNKYIYTKEDNSDNVVRRESLLFLKKREGNVPTSVTAYNQYSYISFSVEKLVTDKGEGVC